MVFNNTYFINIKKELAVNHREFVTGNLWLYNELHITPQTTISLRHRVIFPLFHLPPRRARGAL